MNAPLHALAPTAHRRIMIGDMGRILVEDNIDLGDDRAAILALVRKGHREDDIAVLLDAAIESARSLSALFATPGA